MLQPTVYEKEKAIQFLIKQFEQIEPDTLFRVRLWKDTSQEKFTDIQAKVNIVGFSEKHRKELGHFEMLREKNGSVFYYGEHQPNYLLVLVYGGKSHLLSIDDATARRSGFGNSTLHVASRSWKKAASIGIYVNNIYIGKEALGYFKHIILKRIAGNTYTARFGKWVSKRVSPRNITKADSDSMAISYAVKYPDKDTLNTMAIGQNIKSIQFTPGDTEKGFAHTIKVQQKLDSTTVKFSGFVIEADVPGKEIGAKLSQSSYVYLLGVSLNSPVNLIIVRHHGKQ